MLSCIEKTGILGVEVEAGNIMLHWSSKLVFHQINCKTFICKNHSGLYRDIQWLGWIQPMGCSLPTHALRHDRFNKEKIGSKCQTMDVSMSI